MKIIEFISQFLGSYTPVTYTTTEHFWNANTGESWEVLTDVIPAGLAGVDWPFVISGLLLCIVVYCFFKTLGGIICRIF